MTPTLSGNSLMPSSWGLLYTCICPWSAIAEVGDSCRHGRMLRLSIIPYKLIEGKDESVRWLMWDRWKGFRALILLVSSSVGIVSRLSLWESQGLADAFVVIMSTRPLLTKWIGEFCAPVVVTVATAEVENICLKNWLLLHELLSAFGKLDSANATIRSSNSQVEINDAHIRFERVTSLTHALALSPRLEEKRTISEV